MTFDERFDVDKVSEEVNTKNVLATVQYAQDTRKVVREQETKIETLTNEVQTLRGLVNELLSQVGILRGEVYGGGPTEV